MIHFTKGDMFEKDVDIRVNTVNCVGVMGAGVALAFKQRYPDMFQDYQAACKNRDVKPGKLLIWKGGGDWIINFPTKRHWREKSRYEDISIGLVALRNYLAEFRGIRIALPALGCGNGGLEWAIVAPMIEKELVSVDAEIFVFEPADSLQLPKKLKRQSFDRLEKELGEIGFHSFVMPATFFSAGQYRLQVKGNEELLVNQWVAIMTSLDVKDREFSALKSIAAQLGLVANPPTIALIYRSNASEEIAQIFLKNGLAVVLLLPSGPLVKNRLGLSDSKSKITYAILFIDAIEKRNENLSRAAFDMLREGAASILISDPDPTSYQKFIVKFKDKPLFFVKYSTHSNDVVHHLEQNGFRSIGRRPDTGEPNVGPMLCENTKEIEGEFDINQRSPQVASLVTPQQLRQLATMLDSSEITRHGIYLSIVLDQFEGDAREEIQELLMIKK